MKRTGSAKLDYINDYYQKIILVSLEDVSCVDFFFHVVEAGVVAVGDDCLAAAFKCCEVVYYLGAEEGTSIFEGWLVDNHLRSFGFDALHNTLYGAVAEVVGVGLHRQTVDANSRDKQFLSCFPR